MNMVITALFLLIFVGASLLLLLLMAWLLKLGARWAGLPPLGWKRALATALLMSVLPSAIGWGVSQ